METRSSGWPGLYLRSTSSTPAAAAIRAAPPHRVLSGVVDVPDAEGPVRVDIEQAGLRAEDLLGRLRLDAVDDEGDGPGGHLLAGSLVIGLFVLTDSLGSSEGGFNGTAMYDPNAPKRPAPPLEEHPLDIETARHLIDVLAMLEQKTKGNLDEAETKLLASLIYDLRVALFDEQRLPYKEKVTEQQSWNDIPTCKEAGIPTDYVMLRGIFAAPGIKPDQVAYYEGLLKKVAATPDWNVGG